MLFFDHESQVYRVPQGMLQYHYHFIIVIGCMYMYMYCESWWTLTKYNTRQSIYNSYLREILSAEVD